MTIDLKNGNINNKMDEKEIFINKTKNVIKKNKLNNNIQKQEELMPELIKFYKKESNKKILLSIINQETTLSLRLLDWLVTNYAKKYNIRYNLDNINEPLTTVSSKYFHLWLDYKNQLKAVSKKIFDPFCRRQRIFFNIKTDEVISIENDHVGIFNEEKDGIVTTVGQLNFFRWAINNKVIDYAFEHITKIETDMLNFADNKSERKESGRKSSKNSHPAYGGEIKIIVQFN